MNECLYIVGRVVPMQDCKGTVCVRTDVAVARPVETGSPNT